MFDLRAHRDWDGTDPLETTNVDAIVLRWHELRELAAVDPWPSFRVRWHGPGGGDEHTFSPRRGTLAEKLSPALSPPGFARSVEAMIYHVASHTEGLVKRGWLDAPEVEWERVRALPEARVARELAGQGAFRAAPRPIEEEATALREKPTALEAMLQWLVSSPEKPWREHPREVRTSAAYLYVERRDRSFWRLPLDTLRVRLGTTRDDAVYVFGRRTGILLTHRDGCPVRAELDARLTRAPQQT